MLTQYIEEAMKRAKFKRLPENEGYFGTISGFRGVWANANTIRACRLELQSVLEDWLLIKLRHNDDDLPVVRGMNLNPKPRAKKRVA
jgi:hypothetical protein